MFDSITNIFNRKPAPKGGPVAPEPQPLNGASAMHRAPADRKPAYSKVFRWRMPDGQTAAPKAVEIVGSFTKWEKLPLVQDSALDAWHTTVHHIQGHKTHHYMLLVDGVPTYDKHSDGLAIPTGPEEAKYQLMTDKGPRVLMMFAQAK